MGFVWQLDVLLNQQMAIRKFSVFSMLNYMKTICVFWNVMKSMELSLPTSVAKLTDAGTTIT